MPAAAHPAADSSPLLLAIESSCDETAAAVIDRQLVIRSNVVASQIDLHAEFGGVVPEIASRAHLTNILPVLEQALDSAQVTLEQITAVAVVTEPGLVGSLLVGLTAAKAICLAHNLPLTPVHHIEAHLYACRMSAGCDVYPAVGLVVSGGHTSLYDCQGPLESHLVGSTIDDAAGEAFDKVAQLLELGYPGGPHIEQAARNGQPDRIQLPRPMLNLPGLDFSFSGLKTAVRYQVHGVPGTDRTPPEMTPERTADLAASFQDAVIDCLVARSQRALEQLGHQ
ncbi:MAG: tRNA (adenosine(37)-N6)-threonylcarbamoyltransferase complex transferase subunit TsaD, partial [Planctomycetaceae bacterium]